ncbi:PLP-dependent aminotransferase family protein [Magnetovibrio sp.]|uniref:aminotransferase-like domain-containing protein n=1 Tax=Magnetovibrio sp. TaxID=2024836 RepID=UPI002F93F533
MTIYTPHIEDRHGPKYRAIADAVSDDVRDKILPVGAKLPTHRDLAYRLGVTVGTVTRAYSELQRRGVAGGRVGSGTYVLDQIRERQVFPVIGVSNKEILSGTGDRALLDQPDASTTDLSMNRPPPGPETEALAATLSELAHADSLAVLTQYNPAPGLAHHRSAMATLVNTIGLDAETDDMILTSGAQHAMAASAMGLLKAGDVILTENFTYPGMTSLAAHLGVRVRPVAMDEYGVRPEALQAAIHETGARVAYLMPVHQNPTTAVMDMDRLTAIADIAKRNDLVVIEDDVYGFQPERRNPPLAQFAPDNTIYINGFAKSISPGLRVGFMKTPKSLFSTLTRAVQITGWMIPPLMGEIAARWVTSGIAQQIIDWHRREMIARNQIAAEVLQDFTFASKPESLHIWLDLPPDHYADDTIRELSQRGVIMAGPESFITTQPNVPRSLRLCLGSAPSREQLHAALVQVRAVLTAQPVQANHLIGSMVM